MTAPTLPWGNKALPAPPCCDRALPALPCDGRAPPALPCDGRALLLPPCNGGPSLPCCDSELLSLACDIPPLLARGCRDVGLPLAKGCRDMALPPAKGCRDVALPPAKGCRDVATSVEPRESTPPEVEGPGGVAETCHMGVCKTSFKLVKIQGKVGAPQRLWSVKLSTFVEEPRLHLAHQTSQPHPQNRCHYCQ